MVKKLEAEIGKFIWKGKILRVALDELKNDYFSGGLRLPCVGTMNDVLTVFKISLKWRQKVERAS